MSTEHADIIDPNIHEPKGISTAAANTVYICDGSASGEWSKIPPESLTEEVTSFSSQLLHVRQNGIVHSVPANDTWTTVGLNTIVTNDFGASLNANVLTLPAGTYMVDGTAFFAGLAVASGSIKGKARLYNTTTSTAVAESSYGTAINTDPTYYSFNVLNLPIKGRFTLGAESTLVLQIYGRANSGAITDSDIWHNLFFWKIA